MRILWMSNAPWARTGYGVQTRIFARWLRDVLGHEVACMAFFGLEGGKLDWDGIRVYPRAYHPFGQDIVEAHADDWKADLVISLLDIWVCQRESMGPHWAPWFPIDCEPIPLRVAQRAKSSFQPLVFSRFGEDQARAAGLDVMYVPHGVETEVYKPVERMAARDRLEWPQDQFIVGIVAANKGWPSRKCLTQELEAFARFHRRHKDTLLYIHSVAGMYNEEQGVNLPGLIKSLGIGEAVRICDQYKNVLGFSNSYMAAAYSGMDVLLNTSAGEGFGIPILEAQACGCPVIVGDWTAMSEVCFAGLMIPKSEAEPYWTQLEAYQYVPHVGAIEAALEEMYGRDEGRRTGDRERARMGALGYDADLVTRVYWGKALERIEERIAKGEERGEKSEKRGERSEGE